MGPAVSLVVCAYRAERTLGATLSGALRQTYAPLEIVVVADRASGDATRAVAEAHGDRVRIVDQDHLGVAAARNTGVDAATGPLVTFCDADDLLFDEHVAALVAVWERDGGIATANAWWWFPGGIRRGATRHKGPLPPPARQRRALLEANFVSTMSLFERSAWDDVGGFDESLTHAEDWDFWLRLVLDGHRVAHQPRPLALYRWDPGGLTAQTDAMDAGVRAVLAKAARRGDLTPDERAYVERRLASPGPQALARAGDRALAAGRYHDAARDWREASSLVPSEQALRRKARLLSCAPGLVGPALRARSRLAARASGTDERFER